MCTCSLPHCGTLVVLAGGATRVQRGRVYMGACIRVYEYLHRFSRFYAFPRLRTDLLRTVPVTVCNGVSAGTVSVRVRCQCGYGVSAGTVCVLRA